MKHTLWLADYIDHMQQAAIQAIGFVESMDKAAFVGDPRTQSAVVYKLMVLGKAAANILAHDAAFAAAHVDVPWRTIRATRTVLRTATLTSTWTWSGTRCKRHYPNS